LIKILKNALFLQPLYFESNFEKCLCQHESQFRDFHPLPVTSKETKAKEEEERRIEKKQRKKTKEERNRYLYTYFAIHSPKERRKE